MSKVFDKMLKKGTARKTKGVDQTLLAQYLWPEFGADAVHHDAYKCKAFGRRGGDMRPFPTQRISGKSENCCCKIIFSKSSTIWKSSTEIG